MGALGFFVKWSLGIAMPETQTSRVEQAALEKYVKSRKRVVEIGVWHGVNTKRMRGAMDEHGVFFAVDPFPVGRLRFSTQQQIAQEVVAQQRGAPVRWIRETGAQAAADHVAAAEDPVDFIFFDGDHSYEGLRSDWEGWADLIMPGGLAAFHDAHPVPGRCPDHAGSVKYVNSVVSADPRFEPVETIESLRIFRRKAEPAAAE
jgi:predicted O-methyltransferase YrrM